MLSNPSQSPSLACRPTICLGECTVPGGSDLSSSPICAKPGMEGGDDDGEPDEYMGSELAKPKPGMPWSSAHQQDKPVQSIVTRGRFTITFTFFSS